MNNEKLVSAFGVDASPFHASWKFFSQQKLKKFNQNAFFVGQKSQLTAEVKFPMRKF